MQNQNATAINQLQDNCPSQRAGWMDISIWLLSKQSTALSRLRSSRWLFNARAMLTNNNCPHLMNPQVTSQGRKGLMSNGCWNRVTNVWKGIVYKTGSHRIHLDIFCSLSSSLSSLWQWSLIIDKSRLEAGWKFWSRFAVFCLGLSKVLMPSWLLP